MTIVRNGCVRTLYLISPPLYSWVERSFTIETTLIPLHEPTLALTLDTYLGDPGQITTVDPTLSSTFIALNKPK